MRVVLLLIALALSSAADAKSLQSRVRERNPTLANPLKYLIEPEVLSLGSVAKWYVIGLPWCAFTGTAIMTIRLRREPKPSEAYPVIASCFLPFIGGMIMKRLFAQHPEWDALFRKPEPVDFGIGSQS